MARLFLPCSIIFSASSRMRGSRGSATTVRYRTPCHRSMRPPNDSKADEFVPSWAWGCRPHRPKPKVDIIRRSDARFRPVLAHSQPDLNESRVNRPGSRKLFSLGRSAFSCTDGDFAPLEELLYRLPDPFPVYLPDLPPNSLSYPLHRLPKQVLQALPALSTGRLQRRSAGIDNRWGNYQPHSSLGHLFCIVFHVPILADLSVFRESFSLSTRDRAIVALRFVSAV